MAPTVPPLNAHGGRAPPTTKSPGGAPAAAAASHAKDKGGTASPTPGEGGGKEQVQMAGDSIILEEEIDPNYVPTEDEVKEYAKWLGMDLDKDQELFWIAKEGLKAPLPEHWKPCKTVDTDEIYYFNFVSGESTWDHPCDEYYRKLYEEENRKKLEAQRAANDKVKQQAKKDVDQLLGKDTKAKKKKRKASTAPLTTSDIGDVGSARALSPLDRRPLPDISSSRPSHLRKEVTDDARPSSAPSSSSNRSSRRPGDGGPERDTGRNRKGEEVEGRGGGGVHSEDDDVDDDGGSISDGGAQLQDWTQRHRENLQREQARHDRKMEKLRMQLAREEMDLKHRREVVAKQLAEVELEESSRVKELRVQLQREEEELRTDLHDVRGEARERTELENEVRKWKRRASELEEAISKSEAESLQHIRGLTRELSREKQAVFQAEEHSKTVAKDLQEQLSNAQEDLVEAEGEVKELKVRLKETKEYVAEVEGRAGSSSRELREQMLALREANEEGVNRAASRIRELELQVLRLEKEVAAAESVTLQARESTAGDVGSARHAREMAEAEAEALRAQVATLLATKSRMEEEIRELVADISSAATLKSSVERELRAAISEAEKALQTASIARDEAVSECEGLRAQLASLEADKSGSAEEWRQGRAELEAARAKAEAQARQALTASRAHATRVASLRESSEALSMRAATAEEQLAELRVKLEESEGQCRALRGVVEEGKEKLSSAETQLAESSNRAAGLEADLLQLKTAMQGAEGLEAASGQLKQKLLAVTADEKNAKKEVHKLRQLIDKEEKARLEAESRLSALSGQMEDALASRAASESVAEDLKHEKQRIEEELRRVAGSFSALEKALEVEKQRAANTATTGHRDTGPDVARLTARLKAAQEDAATERARYEDLLRELGQELVSAKEEGERYHRESKSVAADLQARLRQALRHVDSLEVAAQASETDVNWHKDAMKRLETDLEESRVREKELRTELAIANSGQRELKESQKRLTLTESKLQEATLAKNALHDEVEDLRNTLSKHQGAASPSSAYSDRRPESIPSRDSDDDDAANTPPRVSRSKAKEHKKSTTGSSRRRSRQSSSKKAAGAALPKGWKEKMEAERHLLGVSRQLLMEQKDQIKATQRQLKELQAQWRRAAAKSGGSSSRKKALAQEKTALDEEVHGLNAFVNQMRESRRWLDEREVKIQELEAAVMRTTLRSLSSSSDASSLATVSVESAMSSEAEDDAKGLDRPLSPRAAGLAEVRRLQRELEADLAYFRSGRPPVQAAPLSHSQQYMGGTKRGSIFSRPDVASELDALREAQSRALGDMGYYASFPAQRAVPFAQFHDPERLEPGLEAWIASRGRDIPSSLPASVAVAGRPLLSKVWADERQQAHRAVASAVNWLSDLQSDMAAHQFGSGAMSLGPAAGGNNANQSFSEAANALLSPRTTTPYQRRSSLLGISAARYGTPGNALFS
jgi:hypothetical protein